MVSLFYHKHCTRLIVSVINVQLITIPYCQASLRRGKFYFNADYNNHQPIYKVQYSIHKCDQKKRLSNTPSLLDQCNLILNMASYTASQVVESMIAKITITIAIAAIIVRAFLRKVMKFTLITSHHYNFCLDHSKTIVGSGLSSERGHYYFNTIQNNRQPKHSIQHSIHNW